MIEQTSLFSLPKHTCQTQKYSGKDDPGCPCDALVTSVSVGLETTCWGTAAVALSSILPSLEIESGQDSGVCSRV